MWRLRVSTCGERAAVLQHGFICRVGGWHPVGCGLESPSIDSLFKVKLGQGIYYAWNNLFWVFLNSLECYNWKWVLEVIHHNSCLTDNWDSEINRLAGTGGGEIREKTGASVVPQNEDWSQMGAPLDKDTRAPQADVRKPDFIFLLITFCFTSSWLRHVSNLETLP